MFDADDFGADEFLAPMPKMRRPISDEISVTCSERTGGGAVMLSPLASVARPVDGARKITGAHWPEDITRNGIILWPTGFDRM